MPPGVSDMVSTGDDGSARAFTVAPVSPSVRLPVQSTSGSHACTRPAMLNDPDVVEPSPLAEAASV